MSSAKNVIKDNYNAMLINDFLREKIKDAGFSNVEISKNPTGTRVTLHVTRPGIVIGRKGSGIKELTEILEKEFNLKNPQIAVEEILKPELSPNVMCNRMASHLERGTAFRRATMWTMQQIMDNGAMGTQITISGKLRGDRSAFEKHSAGILPRAGHHADVIVSEDIVHVETAMGLIGVRIRIALKEKLIPEFELKGKSKEIIAEEERKKEESEKAKTESEQIKLDAEKSKEMHVEEERKKEESEKAKTESEQIKLDAEKSKEMHVEEERKKEESEKAKTESEQIKLDAEKMKEMPDTMEEREEELK